MFSCSYLLAVIILPTRINTPHTLKYFLHFSMSERKAVLLTKEQTPPTILLIHKNHNVLQKTKFCHCADLLRMWKTRLGFMQKKRDWSVFIMGECYCTVKQWVALIYIQIIFSNSIGNIVRMLSRLEISMNVQLHPQTKYAHNYRCSNIFKWALKFAIKMEYKNSLHIFF